jgi:DNA helicase HerA-like ATPase
MVMGRTGPLAGKKGRPAHYGKKLEYKIAYAEVLGYYDEKRKWRALESAPSAWDEIYEPTEDELKSFFIPNEVASDMHFIEIGKVRGTSIPAYIDLNAVAKAHLLIAGMTRAGKSSFIINLVARSTSLTPRSRFIIFDRRGEYGALTRYGAKVLSYSMFVPPIRDPDLIADKLGVKRDERALIVNSVEELLKAGSPITSESLLDKIVEIAPSIIKREETREEALKFLKRIIERRGDFLQRQREPQDIVRIVRENPVTVIDFSVDADFEAQQFAAREIIHKITSYAMERKDVGDFAAIIAIEEAQYLAPEKGLEIEESVAQRDVKRKMIEAISQAGGYNVGFIIMTQRPAYVLKSVISQCNTVACFRLKSGNDQDAILQYTEYGSERLRDYLPGLADHEAMLWGIAVPTPFPVITEIKVTEYPQKAAVFAKQAWQKMEKPREEVKKFPVEGDVNPPIL